MKDRVNQLELKETIRHLAFLQSELLTASPDRSDIIAAIGKLKNIQRRNEETTND